MIKNPVTVAVLGAGNRGNDVYGRYIKEHPGEIKVVAVAEPDQNKRVTFAREHNIAEKNSYLSWEQLLSDEKKADGLIISTLDKMHVKPALLAMDKGYTILLEKPIAPTWQETLMLAKKARTTGSEIVVAHVLRYTKFYQQLKMMLDRGDIGQVRFVDHIENIGFYHFAHSYVRGNWRNTEVAAPIILAKSSHDLDLIYWLLGRKAESLTSHASLEYFKAEMQPEKASDRCIYCILKESCPYSATRIYLTENIGWPTSVITADLSYHSRYRALKEGPYGRCVWKCDNNVPEVQRVNLTLEDNIEVNFALTAFSSEINRTSKFFGTEGEIRADFAEGIIEVYRYGLSKNTFNIIEEKGGHGGGDTGLMHHFVSLLKNKNDNALTGVENSLESHLLAFAAEEARRRGMLIELNSWRTEI